MYLQKHRFRRCFPRKNRLKKKNRQSKRVFLFLRKTYRPFLTSFPYSNRSDVAKLCLNAFALLVLPSKSQTKEKEGRNLLRSSCLSDFARLFFCITRKIGIEIYPLALSDAKRFAICRQPFIATISTAMSAGDTPDMRDACPRLSGLISESFWRASIRNALMDS